MELICVLWLECGVEEYPLQQSLTPSIVQDSPHKGEAVG